MKTFHVTSAYASDLAKQGFASFDSFFDHADGTVVNRNTKRDVARIELPMSPGNETCFLKRFFNPHFKDMAFGFRNYRTICSQGEIEWRNAHSLLAQGIETYRPVAWGVETRFGIERRSFFVSERIRGRSLVEFFFERAGEIGLEEKRLLVGAVGDLFLKIIRAGFCLPDAYLWHLFLLDSRGGADSGEFRFAMIDLHRMRLRCGFRWSAARMLAAFFFSIPEEWFDISERRVIFETVAAELGPFEKNALLSSIERRERVLVRRRKKPSLERLRRFI